MADSGVLKVAARTSLTPKHTVMMIQLPKRLVLVGVSPERVDTLCEITDPQEVADLLARTQLPQRRGAKRFDDVMLREAIQYDSVDVDHLTTEHASSRSSGGSDGALTGLLRRIKTLQTKTR